MAQLAARGSHNPKVASSILAGSIIFVSAFHTCCPLPCTVSFICFVISIFFVGLVAFLAQWTALFRLVHSLAQWTALFTLQKQKRKKNREGSPQRGSNS